MIAIRAGFVVALLFVASCRHARPAPEGPVVQGVPNAPHQAQYAFVNGDYEQVPSDLSRDTVMDEATLDIGRDGQCIALTLRTARAIDEPLSMHELECEADDGEDVPARIMGAEKVSNREYPFKGEAPKLEIRGRTSAVSIPLGPGEDKVFRVVERKVRVCCPVVAGKSLEFLVYSKAGGPTPRRVEFEWELSPPAAASTGHPAASAR